MNQTETTANNPKALIEKLPMMGHVVWLYSQLPTHRHFFITDLEWMLLPPLVLNQCKLYTKEDMPVAFASWAFVNEDVEQRLLAGQIRMSPNDWQSGDKLVLVDLVAPFGGAEDVMYSLKREMFSELDLYRTRVNPATRKMTLEAVPLKPKEKLN